MNAVDPTQTPHCILMMMSGSIACEKASGLISRLTELGHAVRVVCTASVFEFVSSDQLLALGAEQVHHDTFDPEAPMAHIDLSRWSDLMILCPATANSINRLAAGLADDMVSTTWIAGFGQNKPMLLVPAMNTLMLNYPATRMSLERMAEWGITVLPTASGSLACGETGEGRMLEVEQIQGAVMRALKTPQPKEPLTILITTGGTREYIDGVRYIGNLSTGRTGALLARHLSEAGHHVHCLSSAHAMTPERVDQVVRFDTFDELAAGLERALVSTQVDLVIQAAAISDFHVSGIDGADASQAHTADRDRKIDSGANMSIHLSPNPKLLSSLRAMSCNPDIRVVGFKLTQTLDLDERLAAVRRQFQDAGVDAVVHNDLNLISDGQHPFVLFDQNPQSAATSGHHCESVGELGERLLEWVASSVQPRDRSA